MKVLARKYSVNQDEVNRWFDTLEEALSYLGQSKESIVTKVDWLNYTDIFFKNTNNYLRVKNYE